MIMFLLQTGPNSQEARNLQAAAVVVGSDSEECRERWRRAQWPKEIVASQMCARGARARSACHGDSGGAPGLHCQEHPRKERHGRGRVHGQAVRPCSSDQYTQRVQQSVLLHALDPRKYGIIERVD